MYFCMWFFVKMEICARARTPHKVEGGYGLINHN